MKYIFIITLSLLITSCDNSQKKQSTETTETKTINYFQTTGYAQGTTYNVIYEDSLARNLSISVDSILKDFDQQLSIYIDSSIISKVTKLKKDSSFTFNNKPHFVGCFKLAKQVYTKTNHAFNPAIYPLVKYWGFLNFEQADEEHQQSEIDSLLQLIDFSDSAIHLVTEKNRTIATKYKTSSFDFNAIAQGYSVDVIANFLNDLGISNYMVEVGGELKTKGVNSKHQPWRIGIDKPIENSKPGEQEFQIIASLSNKALATSGNYRKFYEKDGIKYSHTIDPNTGKPVQHQLLSTTVVTENCALADAYATAFMVMGIEETKLFLKQNKDLNLSVYLVYSDSTSKWHTWQTVDFETLIVK